MEAIEQYRKLSANTTEYFECQLPVVAETEKAICFDADRGHLNKTKEVWLPKSQMVILDLGRNDGGIRYFVKNWLYPKIK